MIIIITALCLISLARAEEKKGGRIEPKLVYEKRFDFEIGNGKLAADGEMYPLILLTKGFDEKGHKKYNKVLFFNEKGEKAKTLNLTNNRFPVLSEDGRYVGVVGFSEIQLYDYTGKMLWRVIPEKNYYPDIAITKNAEGIAISYWTQSAGLAWVDFYTREGKITKTYIEPNPFPVDSTPISDTILQKSQAIKNDPHWQANSIDEFVHRFTTFLTIKNYFYSKAKGTKSSWFAIFSPNGDVVNIIELYGEDVLSVALSADLKSFIYCSQPLYYLQPIEDENRIIVKLYNILENKQIQTEINIKPVENTLFWTHLYFSKNSKYFCVTNGNRFYFGDVRNGKIIYSWESPSNVAIKSAAISSEGNYAVLIMEDNRMYIIDRNGEVLFESKGGSRIIDVQIDERKEIINILKENGLYKYSW